MKTFWAVLVWGVVASTCLTVITRCEPGYLYTVLAEKGR